MAQVQGVAQADAAAESSSTTCPASACSLPKSTRAHVCMRTCMHARTQKAQDAYDAADGATADRRVANVLTGLGFSAEQYDKRCSEFSGGWQMRIALARLLVSTVR